MKARRLVGGMGAGWLAWRLLGPELQPRYRVPQEHPLPLPGRSLFVGEREFFVRQIGPEEATNVVLVHGWAYDGLTTWHRVIPTLAAEFRVTVVDQRNHGRTDAMRGRFTIEDLADDLSGVLDSVGIRGAVVAGYSMGGMAAQALARRHPDKVARLVLSGTAARPIPRRRPLVRIAFALARALERLSMVEWARAIHRYLLRVGAVEPRHSRWLWEQLLDRDATLSFESGFAVWHYDARPWIGDLTVPTLVIVPSADQLVPPSVQRELAAAIPDARLVELPGAGHEAVLTHADDIAKAIVHFAREAGSLSLG